MPKKIYYTAKGKPVDMDAMRAANASKPAISNGARKNAAGDILSRSGAVLVRRDQIVENYYKSNPNQVAQADIKTLDPDVFPTPQQAFEALKKANANPVSPTNNAPKLDQTRRRKIQ